MPGLSDIQVAPMRTVPARKTRRERRKRELASLTRLRESRNKELHRRILVEGRIDILAELVGLYFHSFHDVLWEHTLTHRYAISLGPRGWGKSTICTALKAVYEIIRDRDVRILIASSSADRAQDMLTMIKLILENDRIVEIFGRFKSTDKKWAEKSIIVHGRSKVYKEPTVSTAGIGTGIASGHFDVILADDLCVEVNSGTKIQREKVKKWFATTLFPCIIDATTQFHVMGTRYHPDDLYGDLLENPTFHALVIPALNLQGETNYPERFTTQDLLNQRITMQVGSAWDSQMMQDPSALSGDVFDRDFFKYVDEPPSENFFTFTGVDLAIGQEDKHDKFAWVTIGVSTADIRRVYVLDFFTARLSVFKQDEILLLNYQRFKPLITGIESNHFQAAKSQRVKEAGKQAGLGINPHPIPTSKDKTSRAQMLALRYEAGDIIHLEHLRGSELESQLLGFPTHQFKDLFDALDIAVNLVMHRRARKKKRKREPGLIRAGRSPLLRRWRG